jgi:type I restriction enzyme S subunit
MSSETKEDVGKCSCLKDEVGELYLNTFCKGYRIYDNSVSPLFLNYLLSGKIYRDILSNEGNGFTRINLRLDRVNNFQIFLPPLEEQEQIVAFLDEKTSIIDKSISIEERRIGLLKEYRQSLISEVITGKIKVSADE